MTRPDADTNLKSLEKTVNSELLKVSDCLNANKLTLNAKKSNYVIFRPYQRKLNYSVNIEMIDNCTQIPTTHECKDRVKYLGVLLGSNLSWKFHINNVALKVSRTVDVVARLTHFVPRTTLLNIYEFLILSSLTYGLSKPIYKKFSCYKNKSFLTYFSEPRAHAMALFISSNILPLQMLYAEKVSSIMFDVSCLNAPSSICDLFIKANSKHKHETRFCSSEIIMSKLQERIKISFGAKLWNAIPNEFC